MANRAEKVLGYELRRLPSEVREKVIERHAQWNAEDQWWDYVYEDAKRIGALMGIEIDEIQFSGFWSQGDGASFTGTYACKADAIEAVKEYAPKDEKLHRIATELTELQATLKLQYGATFECHIGRSHYGNCVHSNMMELNDWGTEALSEAFEQKDWNGSDELWRTFLKILRSFADWIYRQLEEEYEYLTSEEHVAERIVEQGLRFSPTGDILRA